MSANDKNYLHLEASNSVTDGKSRRSTLLYQDGSTKKAEIFYEFDRIVPWSEDSLLDGHVFAVLFYASNLGKPLRVHGKLSHLSLRNMYEILTAWRMWKPDIYKVIEIIPDEIIRTRKAKTEEKAICAFSGGVDSLFTALSHCCLLPENTRYPLKAGLMVHGFDVEMYNYDDFNGLANRVAPFLKEMGLDLYTVRTNSRELKLQDWEDSHAMQLAGCMHMFGEEFSFGLVGSSGPYDGFVIPWGSNPVTDRLISGNDFAIIYDGAGSYRSDKVKALLTSPIACAVLKVCHEARDQSGNCGKCEKCVRTMLNFLATGAKTPPPCFPNGFHPEQINVINIHTLGQYREMNRIVGYARRNGINDPWVEMVAARVTAWQPQAPEAAKSAKDGCSPKKILIKCCVLLGIEEPAKKIWRRLRRKF